MRHGQAESNVSNIISTDPKRENHLTEKGRADVALSAESLKDANIDFIIASPFVRTTETAEIAAETIGFKKENILFDERLYEINAEIADGNTISQ
jgi:probable phosphoglycerate mutase